MKARIYGVLYDTRTSEVLADVYSKSTDNDWRWWGEQLLRTKSGHYFLRGDGGWLTIWARQDFVPLSRDQAVEWTKKHLAPAKFKRMTFP